MTNFETNKEKQKAFDAALAMINKEIKTSTGGVAISKMGDLAKSNIERLSTGSLVFDSILGGGIPKGRMIEFFGPEASGKTSFALNAAADVQKKGGTVAFVDVEQAFNSEYAATLGLDVDKIAFAQPDYAEQALNIVHKLAESAVVDLIIVDSIAAMTPKAELEGDMEDQTIGLLARIMGKALRRITPVANKTGTTIIWINQVRDAVGVFSPMGTPVTTPGGKAMKFFASQRVEVKRIGHVKEGQEIIGNRVKLNVKKNKSGKPFLTGETTLTFTAGIDKRAELQEVAVELGLVERPTPRQYVEAATGEILGKSKDEYLERLKTDDELYERLVATLDARLNTSTVAPTKEELAESEAGV